MKVDNRQKRVLVIDAVVWSPLHENTSPLRDVYGWFARCLTGLPHLSLMRATAEEDIAARVRNGVDGVLISGSPRDAWNDDPVNLRLCEAIGVCQERATPILGVCYGHQLLGRALGGRVDRHPLGLELGNTEVELTPAGLASPLFAGMPERFEVLSSHADAVLELPPGGVLMARGDFTVNQGFHWKNRFFGIQFHPESDPETMRYIWSARRDNWRSKVAFDLDQTLNNLRPTPIAAQLLRNFVTHIIT